MTEFAKNVAANLDEGLVTMICFYILQGILSGVDLKFLVVRYNLDDPLPDFITDVITSHCDQPKRYINIPLNICRVFLCQNSYFEHHFFSNCKVGVLEVFEELPD